MFVAATCRRHHRTSPNQADPHLGQILPVQRRHRLYQALVPTRTRPERTAANAVLSSCGCLKNADPRRELGSQFPIGDAHVVLGLQVQREPRLHAEKHAEPKRSVSRDGPLAIHQLADTAPRHVDVRRQLAATDAQRLHEIVQQDIAWMNLFEQLGHVPTSQWWSTITTRWAPSVFLIQHQDQPSHLRKPSRSASVAGCPRAPAAPRRLGSGADRQAISTADGPAQSAWSTS